MYLASDYFLSDTATVEVVTNDPWLTNDVHILVRDLNGSFQISAYMSYPEMQALVATYHRHTTHSSIKFGDFRVYADRGGKVDDLKFTLEMI